MQFTAKTYRRLAIVLWGVVCSVIGWSIGYTLGWGERKLVFAVAVAVGVYALFMLQKTASAQLAGSEGQMQKSEAASENKRAAGAIEHGTGMEKPVVGNKGGWLADKKELARQRLDELLLIQQNK